MKNLMVLCLLGLSFAGASYGHGKDKAHCEKKNADGKIEDVEVKDKEECNTKGGKWMEAAKGKHDHKEGEKHEDHEHKH